MLLRVTKREKHWRDIAEKKRCSEPMKWRERWERAKKGEGGRGGSEERGAGMERWEDNVMGDGVNGGWRCVG